MRKCLRRKNIQVTDFNWNLKMRWNWTRFCKLKIKTKWRGLLKNQIRLVWMPYYPLSKLEVNLLNQDLSEFHLFRFVILKLIPGLQTDKTKWSCKGTRLELSTFTRKRDWINENRFKSVKPFQKFPERKSFNFSRLKNS